MFSCSVQAKPELYADTSVSTAGYFSLSWSGINKRKTSQAFVLQQSRDESFTNAFTRYTGTDTSTAISGLEDGFYYFRVRDKSNKDWSETIAVKVEHHPLSRALGFLVLGAVMFIILLIALFHGNRGNRMAQS